MSMHYIALELYVLHFEFFGGAAECPHVQNKN